MEKIADCYIKLGLEEKFQDMSVSTQYFQLAEQFYNKAGNLTKSSSDDGKYLLGKLANLYYFSSQHRKALPLYEEILQNESLHHHPKTKIYMIVHPIVKAYAFFYE